MVPAAKNFVEFVKRIDLILKLSFLHKIKKKNTPKTVKERHEETFGHDGYVYYLDCGDGLQVYISSSFSSVQLLSHV